MTLVRRRTIVINNSGSTQDFVTKRLLNGESFELDDRDFANWRDEPTISGAIASGDLLVSNGEETFATPAQAAYWFYDLPHKAISLILIPGAEVTPSVNEQGTHNVVTISGENLIGIQKSGSTISISTSAASAADLANVSGTLTGDIATLSGSLQETIVTVTGVLLEIVTTIESPAKTVQQGFTDQDNTLSTTNSTQFQNKLVLGADTTLVVSGTDPHPWRLQWYYEWGYSGANSEFEGRIYLDDFDDLGGVKWRPSATSSSDFNAHSGYEDMQLTAGTHTISIQYRSTAGNKTSRIKRSRLSLVPLTLSTVSSAPPIRGNP